MTRTLPASNQPAAAPRNQQTGKLGRNHAVTIRLLWFGLQTFLAQNRDDGEMLTLPQKEIACTFLAGLVHNGSKLPHTDANSIGRSGGSVVPFLPLCCLPASQNRF